jgi:acyl carrier protein
MHDRTEPLDTTALEDTVRRVVADALDVASEDVAMDASLRDALGAESIDFLDLVFRLEGTFGLKIPTQEVWSGGLGDDPTPEAIAAHVAALRHRMPDFDWAGFPAQPTRHDLGRLITPRTIVEYLQSRLAPPS